MIKNYFILNRLIVEFNSELQGFTINQIFSQEKNILMLECIKNNVVKFIEISVNPGFPYINLKSNYSRAKKNTIDFFQEYLPAEIISFEIAKADRVIRINLSTVTLYFTIRGKYTDVISIDNKNVIGLFKRVIEDSKEIFFDEVQHMEFTCTFNKPLLHLTNENTGIDTIKKRYPFLGKEILFEARRRIDKNTKEDIIQEILIIIDEIIHERPTVFYNAVLKQNFLSVGSFKIFSYTEKFDFENMADALNFFLSKHFRLIEIVKREKVIKKRLERELSRVSSKLNNLKGNIDRGSKEEFYSKIANLLLINISSLKKGMEEVEIEDIYNENTILKIKLIGSLSVKRNIDFYFEKAKNEKIRLEKSKQLYKESLNKYNRLKKIEEEFKAANGIEDYKLIMKELNIKNIKESGIKDDIKSKFKNYLIEGKYRLFVGKDSKSNDMLTTKFAKQNDYWFHARSVPGSHVVLRVEKTKEGIPKTVLKKAASIAAFHSKAKTSSLAPVSYTLKKYVVKKKGMEPGKVALLKEDVLLVKPGIPTDCEFITEE